MTDTPDQNLNENPKNPGADDVFAGELNLTPTTEDIFAGGKELEKVLEGQSEVEGMPDHSVSYQVQGPAGSAGAGKKVTGIHVMIGVLTIAIIIMMFRPAPEVKLPVGYVAPTFIIEPNDVQEKDIPAKVEPVEVQVAAGTDPSIDPTGEQYQFDTTLSWNLAHTLFTEKEYGKAHYVYKKLSENISIDNSQSDMLKDIMNLQMALCLFLDHRSDNLSSLLTVVLDSRSPAVRALANYYIGFIDFRSKQYLSARSRAYRVLATLEIIEDLFPESMESDCYFLMANSITCEVQRLNNSDSSMPGKFWSDTLVPYFIPEMDKKELMVFLNRGVSDLSVAVLEPIVKNRKGITVGEKYSVVANKSSVEEVIAKFASTSKYEIKWSNDSLSYKQFPVTMLLSKTSEQAIPEFALGSLGLIARFDTSVINVYNSKMETSLNKQKELLTKEAIAVWMRFLLRYRGDHRIANARFSLAMMYELSEMPGVALGEYKVILSRHTNDSLAPFALLNSSKIYTNLRDYPSAQELFERLVLEYPNAKIADEAYLYLAKANLSIKLYAEAFSLFKKVYYVNLTSLVRAEGAYGAALSKYYLKDYIAAEEWFGKCFKVLTNPPSIDVYKAYYFLGKTKFALGEYTEAVSAYKYALSGNLSKEEFCKIVLQITETLVEKGDVAEAANLIENVPEESLPPLQQCEIVIAKARIYIAMNLPGHGIKILKGRIAYMADHQLRSMLMLELGRCYLAAGQVEKAYDEVAISITTMPPGNLLLAADIEFAEICMMLGKDQQAVEFCLRVLNSPNTKETRYLTCRILGRAYKKQKKFNKAAEAFAGIFDKNEMSKNE
jgi:tetratricopeptide (TPR) repeat protein